MTPPRSACLPSQALRYLSYLSDPSFLSLLIQLTILRAKADISSYIPAGASDHPLGGMGFTNLLLEVAEQEKILGIFFDTLIVCSVTGSSHAGTLVGAVAEGRGRRIIGIDASGKPEATRAQVARIARATARVLDEGLVIRDEDVVLDDRFHAGVYGVPDEGTLDAMKCELFLLCHDYSVVILADIVLVAARTDSMITDPVYEVGIFPKCEGRVLNPLRASQWRV